MCRAFSNRQRRDSAQLKESSNVRLARSDSSSPYFWLEVYLRPRREQHSVQFHLRAEVSCWASCASCPAECWGLQTPTDRRNTLVSPQTHVVWQINNYSRNTKAFSKCSILKVLKYLLLKLGWSSQGAFYQQIIICITIAPGNLVINRPPLYKHWTKKTVSAKLFHKKQRCSRSSYWWFHFQGWAPNVQLHEPVNISSLGAPCT